MRARLAGRLSRSGWILALVLVTGLLHGLVYIFVVPPWQHYDEPNHFEYAALIARNLALPTPEAYDRELRLEIVRSMEAHDFFAEMDYFQQDLTDTSRKVWIGPAEQLGNPPLYYAWAALPVRLALGGSLEAQLYAARLGSLGLYLLALLSAWGIARLLFPPGHDLRWLAPLGVALLPGLADSLTAVNSDAAAVAAVSLVLWGSLDLARRGWRWHVALFTALAVLISYGTKESAYFALPLFVLGLLFALLRGSRRRIVWGLLAGGVLILPALLLGRDDAATWYRMSTQPEPLRQALPGALLGEVTAVVDTRFGASPAWQVPFFQPVPGATGTGLGNRSYTLGVWMWAERAGSLRLPQVGDNGNRYMPAAEVGLAPAFFAYHVTLTPVDAHRVWVALAPAPRGTSADPGRVYYDGLVLAEGLRPLDEPPVFTDPAGEAGTWGGQPFTNLLRNGSFERAGWRLRPQFDNWLARIMPDMPSVYLGALLDWRGSGWFIRISGERLLRTFWGQFGWGHVNLLGGKPYRALAVVTLLGLLGGVAWLGWRAWRRQEVPWEGVALFGLLLLFSFGSALLRAVGHMASWRLYLPVARNAYPAIIPAMFWLGVGWLGWLLAFRTGINRVLPRQWAAPRWLPGVVYLVALLVFDLLAVMSILAYYGRS